MFQYIIHKVFYGCLTLFGVVTIIFFLFNVLPGDPARMLMGQREDSEQLKNIRKKYGFDQPVFTQYLYYLNDVSPVSFHSTDSDNYTLAYATGISQTVLTGPLGYTSVVPPGSTIVRIQSTGVCTNFTDAPITL